MRVKCVAPLLAICLGASDGIAGLSINYDHLNRPTTVNSLNVPGFGMFNVVVDYSGKPFNDQFGPGMPPAITPQSLSWNNDSLAVAAASSLAEALAADPTAAPSEHVHIVFPTEIGLTPTSFNDPDVVHFFGDSEWHTQKATIAGMRDNPFGGGAWATITTVPEASAFACVGLAALCLLVRAKLNLYMR